MKVTKHKSTKRDLYKDLTRDNNPSINFIMSKQYFDLNLTRFPKLIWYMVV